MGKRIQEIIEQCGVENLRFAIPMQKIHGIPGLGVPLGFTDSHDGHDRVECVIDESRYKLSDNYKIELRATDTANTNASAYYGSRSFYLMDLTNLLATSPEDYSYFVPMDLDRYTALTNQWHRIPSDLRLGQYLINEMDFPIVDPEVFHQKDPNVAAALFYSRYVKKD